MYLLINFALNIPTTRTGDKFTPTPTPPKKWFRSRQVYLVPPKNRDSQRCEQSNNSFIFTSNTHTHTHTHTNTHVHVSIEKGVD